MVLRCPLELCSGEQEEEEEQEEEGGARCFRGGAEPVSRGGGEGREPLSCGERAAGSLARGAEPGPGPAGRWRRWQRHRLCSGPWDGGVTAGAWSLRCQQLRG